LKLYLLEIHPGCVINAVILTNLIDMV